MPTTFEKGLGVKTSRRLKFLAGILILSSCGSGSPRRSEFEPLRGFLAGQEVSIDTRNLSEVGVFFDFEVLDLNFDFYPSDVTCQLKNASWVQAVKVSNERIADTTRSRIGTFKIGVGQPAATVKRVDQAGRETPLFVGKRDRGA